MHQTENLQFDSSLNQIVAETTPYPNCRHDMQVQRSILRQEYPGQQNERFGYWPFNQVWPLIEACWQMRPEDRYSASKLIEVFAQVASGVQIRTRPNGSMSPRLVTCYYHSQAFS